MAVRIEGFPPEIEIVPETKREYIEWRDKVLAFREWCHRVCETEGEGRDYILGLASQSKKFWFCVFASLFNPKGGIDYIINDDNEIEEIKVPKGWYPFILYPFQVELIDWHDHIMTIDDDETGKADGVMEKSRDMGATWVFVGIAAHGYTFDDDYMAMFISYKQDMVDSKSQKSMFFKLRSLVGINNRVPKRCHAPGTPYDGAAIRIPDYLVPAGFDPKLHDHKLALSHPTKSNMITGESTTSKSGSGDRLAEVMLDEGAKNPELDTQWSGLTAVTDHRFVFSSAFRKDGDAMYNFVKKARAAQMNPDTPGPSFMSIPWHKHPLRDEGWYRRMRGRHSDDIAGFKREYEIDWKADITDFVYPVADQIVPSFYPYSSIAGQVMGSIDPGIRDPTAIGLFQYQPGTMNKWAMFDALVLDTPSATFLAPILMGWPPDHPMRHYYPEYKDNSIQDIMDVMWQMRKTGKQVRWVGDTYGDQAGGSSSISFYQELLLESVRLNKEHTTWNNEALPPVNLGVLTQYGNARTHRVRKEATTQQLPNILFNSIPRVLYVVDALQNYRYRSQSDTNAVQNEPSAPLHDWTSHPATMVEYFSVASRLMESGKTPMPKPTTATTSRYNVVGG